MSKVYNYSAVAIDGQTVNLADYRGKALLIVNVASQCGFTSQYAGLEELYKRFRSKGFEILAFPCNQFGAQEPGDAEQIKTFCETNYQITFPLFQKIEVNGAQAHPLYVFLKSAAPGILGSEPIKWNFTKFLVAPSGEVLRRFAPSATPESISDEIQNLLQ